MIGRRLIALGLFASVTLATAVPAASAPACRFSSPVPNEHGGQSWLGSCRAGAADGPGVVRIASPGGKAPVLWFGRMTAGLPGKGVVERGGDYYPEAGDDRNANVQAFNAAAAGARAVSRLFAGMGNKRSARFYADEATRLARTLD